MKMENGYKEEIEKYLKDTDDIDFKIRSLRYDNQKLTRANDEEIIKQQKEMENVIFKMKEAHTKPGEAKIQTNMGFTTWKVLKDLYVFTGEAISEIEKVYPKIADRYIKITKTLQKEPLKVAINSGTVVLSSKSFIKEVQLKKFVYKYTGGNK